MNSMKHAEKLIKHVMEHFIIEPDIQFKGDCVELIWANGNKHVKAHVDEHDHMDYIITHDKNYRELNKETLLTTLQNFYNLP